MLASVMYVTVYVTDQDRALKFYTEGLGLEKRIDNSGPEGRFLTVAASSGPDIILWSHAAAAGQPGELGAGGGPGPIFLESDDLRRDFEVLRKRGVTFEQDEPQDYPYGVRIDVRDPDGNLISLRQQRRAQ